MLHPESYKGRKVVVLGLARSGVAVAQVFHRAGAVVTVNDKKERSLCPEADDLAALGISVICGGHPDDLIDQDVSLVVKNPGIPYSIAPIEKAVRLGIEVVTEVEVAYHVCSAPIIGITGSNGKTTTTTLTSLMLTESGVNAVAAGNIGRALTEAALEAVPDQWLVAELSSFQLKGTTDFRPKVAVLLNLYETHLDYHGTMEDYAASKAKLFANQTSGDTAVLNWDNPFCRSLLPSVKANVLPFSYTERLDKGVYLDGDKVMYANGGSPDEIMPVSEIAMKGSFNVENALAAAAAALSAGAKLEAVRSVLASFGGVEHRLEFVRELNGISFYNNSKATNSTATIKTIGAFERENIVLICGGLDRGADYADLLPVFKERVRAVVTMGQTREKLNGIAELAGIERRKTVEACDNPQEAIAQAVRAAYEFASPGDVVLLSPACASWDMFPSYEERGRMFKQSVHTL
ncbi:UDP-N-acetylmuramoyl-L-alanine--D-glutamate ligase [Paenibacillus thermotolerans]|uniref:UDP-N-acetylmuramoyl-L-alanine--D-glutamate ligase n=1 Tax=Paenibacillus thermotolerans TaxID=3027807 RepID=UPI0023684754|nr:MULTISPECIES: UDP-N-acetylmuramoyl-L-alanine--D-glutamate ligase [unclassified Paenibacillus]